MPPRVIAAAAGAEQALIDLQIARRDALQKSFTDLMKVFITNKGIGHVGFFDPKNDRAAKWVNDYESQVELYNTDKRCWAMLLIHCIVKSAKASYDALRSKQDLTAATLVDSNAAAVWKNAKELFLAQFINPADAITAANEFSALTMRDDDSIIDFIDRFLDAVSRAGYNLEEKFIKDQFLLKLTKTIKQSICLDISEKKLSLENSSFEDFSIKAKACAFHTGPQSRNGLKRHFSATGGLVCANHPNATNHTTADCNLNKFQKLGEKPNSAPSRDFKRPSAKFHCNTHGPNSSHDTKDCRASQRARAAPFTPGGITPSASVSPATSQPNAGPRERKTPSSDNWQCVICKEFKPGHYPNTCPKR